MFQHALQGIPTHRKVQALLHTRIALGAFKILNVHPIPLLQNLWGQDPGRVICPSLPKMSRTFLVLY